MTEIEKTKKEIDVLTAKLELLIEMENHKSPCEIAFKRVYGKYPITDIADTCWEGSLWSYFEKGYNASKEDCKVEEEQLATQQGNIKTLIEESVKWCEAVKQGAVSSATKPQTLYDLIVGCMIKYNSTVHPGLICDILDAVDEWLPDDDPHDGEEYQLGWNACLKYIRGKLP